MNIGSLGLIFLATVVAGTALAAEARQSLRVNLDSKEIFINAPRAVLVRTAETPAKVKVEMQVPYGYEYCARYEDRFVYGPAPSCGYDDQCRHVCRDYGWDDYRRRHDICRNMVYECRPLMRWCDHPEPVCAETAIHKYYEARSFKLVFKNVRKLSAGEEEVFEVESFQSDSRFPSDSYALTVVNSRVPYQVRKSNLFGDTIKVVGK